MVPIKTKDDEPFRPADEPQVSGNLYGKDHPDHPDNIYPQEWTSVCPNCDARTHWSFKTLEDRKTQERCFKCAADIPDGALQRGYVV